MSLACSVLLTLLCFFHDTAPTEIYTLSLHDALPIYLLWLIHRSRQSDGTARSLGSFESGSASGMGMVLAGESPRALQSRVVRRRRQALGSNAKASLVERNYAKMGRQRRAGLQGRFQAQGSHGPVHYESGRRRADLCAAWSLRRWTFPGTLRTHRKSD